MTEHELIQYKKTLDLWWEEKKKAFGELLAFQTFGARQCQGVNRYEPDRPLTAAQTYTYKVDYKYKFGFEDSRSASKSIAAVDESADTLTLPKFMKCPLCGTNPGRCEKPLTSEDKACFSCGRELEEL